MVTKQLALPVLRDSLEEGGRPEHERSESGRRKGETPEEAALDYFDKADGKGVSLRDITVWYEKLV